MNWVLIRGLGRESAHWGDFEDIFLSKREGDKIHYIDLPGSGRNYNYQASISMESTIKFIQSDFEKFKNNNDWGIISISLGGMVTLKWLELYPNQFKRVVIINSSASNLTHPFKRFSFKALSICASAVMNKDIVKREKTLLKAISNNPNMYDKASSLNVKIQKQRPIKLTTILSQIILGAQFKATKIESTQILFMNSLGDILVDPICSKKLSEYYNSKLVTHPNAGHDLALDDPCWITDKINEWVRDN